MMVGMNDVAKKTAPKLTKAQLVMLDWLSTRNVSCGYGSAGELRSIKMSGPALAALVRKGLVKHEGSVA
jgi:hypothetical protein